MFQICLEVDTCPRLIKRRNVVDDVKKYSLKITQISTGKNMEAKMRRTVGGLANESLYRDLPKYCPKRSLTCPRMYKLTIEIMDVTDTNQVGLSQPSYSAKSSSDMVVPNLSPFFCPPMAPLVRQSSCTKLTRESHAPNTQGVSIMIFYLKI